MSRMKFIILNLGPFASLSRGNVLSKRTIQLDPLGCSSESGGDDLDSGKDKWIAQKTIWLEGKIIWIVGRVIWIVEKITWIFKIIVQVVEKFTWRRGEDNFDGRKDNLACA